MWQLRSHRRSDFKIHTLIPSGVRLVFEVRDWADAPPQSFTCPRHVAKLYVVTLKSDREGKCKITSAQKIAKKEIECTQSPIFASDLDV